jgi:hypothetical protein
MQMKNRKWMYMAAAAALLVASSASAQKIIAGDDGLTTPGGGTTNVNLSSFPIQEVFGAGIEGNPVVSLRGEALGSGPLQTIDTIVRRNNDVDLRNGTGTGSLEIVALRMVSEKAVSIGGKSYQLHVFLSEFRSDVKPGAITYQMANADGGKFSSSFTVRTKLVFTDEGGRATTIDCGAVDCGAAGNLKMSVTGGNFTIAGVPGGYDPAARGIRGLPAGLAVDGDGDGVAELTTLASSNLAIGVIPSRPTFPPGPTDKDEQIANHTFVGPASTVTPSATAAKQ